MIKIFLTSFTILILFSACTSQEIQLPKKCFEKGKTGMCRGYFKKYHFNQETTKCEKYIYGGCGEVVFHTLDECKRTCEK